MAFGMPPQPRPAVPRARGFISTWGGPGGPLGTGYKPPGAATASPATATPRSAASPATQAAKPAAKRPVDPVYDQAVAALQRRRGDTLAGLAQEQVGTLANYGYGAQFDSSGAPTALAFDPANPFSRAALLRRNYQQAQSGTKNSLASRGQLYSGAMLNAQNANDRGYLQGENALQSSLTQALVGILARRNTAQTDTELGTAQAGAERTNRAIAADTGVKALATPAEQPRVVKDYKAPSGRLGELHIYRNKRVFVPGKK